MRLLQIPLALVGVYLALVTLTWLFQRRLIYLPLGGIVPAVGAVLPGAKAVELVTEDGLRLGAWYVPAAGGESQATVIFCNGNAGNRADRAPLAAALARHGLAVLLFDYRGYGGNAGAPAEAGLYTDLRAARRYATENLGAPPGRQVLFGESLGAAVALAGAVEQPPAGLVLRSPFTSLVAVGRVHYPFLPVAALLRDRYESLARVPHLRCPLLVFAGGLDEIVPVAQSRELYSAATVADKRWVSYPEADHNSRRFLDDRGMMGEVAEFVRRAVGVR